VLGSALAPGARCEILPQFEPEAAWARLASGEVTVFSAVPTIYHRLIAAWDAAPPALQRRGGRRASRAAHDVGIRRAPRRGRSSAGARSAATRCSNATA
jgi:acyl-CoA synthetase (AMP-forming)/AMP-acid ligase II